MTDRAWQRDPDPHLAAVEDTLTALGSTYLYHVHQDLHRALGLPSLPGAVVAEAYRTEHLPEVLAKAAPPSRSGAWASAVAAFDRVRDLQLHRAADLRQLVQAVTDRWYAQELLPTRAAQATVKARLIGLLRARGVPPGGLLPRALDQAAAQIVDPERAAVIDHAREAGAELMDGLRDRTRHLLAQELLDAQAERRTPQQTAARLLDTFATMNRDWRRVAVTEASMHRAHGYLQGVPDGTRVQWVAAAGACGHCARLHGRTFTVRHQPGDPGAEVWPGKTNKGRAFAPRTREGRVRDAEEQASPTIPLHPHCRCRWVRVAAPIPGVSSRLEDYLTHLSAL